MQRIALKIAEQLYNENDPLIIIGIEGSRMVIAEKLFLLLKPLLQLPVLIITCHFNKKDSQVISYSEKIDFNNKNIKKQNKRYLRQTTNTIRSEVKV